MNTMIWFANLRRRRRRLSFFLFFEIGTRSEE
jgi:hypothetical protein